MWPTLAVSGFLAVVAYTFGHDDPTPGLSHRGLLTVALAAVVVVLLTIHRRYGPGSLARAVTEYAVVALLATLLAAAGGAAVDQQPTDRPTRQAQAQAAAGDDQPAVLRAGAKLVQGVAGAAGPSPARSAGWSTCGAKPTRRPHPPRARRWPPRPAPLLPAVLWLRRCL